MRIRSQTLAAWIGVYFLLAWLPMGLALAFDRPPVRAFFIELGVLLGLLGLGVLSMQLVISGRHPWFARGIGQDNVFQFHRQMEFLPDYWCWPTWLPYSWQSRHFWTIYTH